MRKWPGSVSGTPSCEISWISSGNGSVTETSNRSSWSAWSRVKIIEPLKYVYETSLFASHGSTRDTGALLLSLIRERRKKIAFERVMYWIWIFMGDYSDSEEIVMCVKDRWRCKLRVIKLIRFTNYSQFKWLWLFLHKVADSDFVNFCKHFLLSNYHLVFPVIF